MGETIRQNERSGLIARTQRIASAFIAWSHAQLELQQRRRLLWAPVAFGLGAAGYLCLKVEPPLMLTISLAIVAAAAALIAPKLKTPGVVNAMLVLLACAALGFVVCKLRTRAVYAPRMAQIEGPRSVEAYVVDVLSPGQRGARAILAPLWIEGLSPEQTPIRLRASFTGPPPAPGSAIRIYALLNPPPEPAGPGAYDFSMDAYFHSIGGSAIVLGAARPISADPPTPALQFYLSLNAMRWRLTQAIVDVLGERTGGPAAAMITGEEAYLSNDAYSAMRDSGLAHILSISGVHMAVVGGFIFACLRLSIASIPALALRYPGKKIAAVGAGLSVILYLLMSGAPPPAQRSAVVALTAFAAILLDRKAISLNALAISALIVLIIQPEAVTQPGFQMSYAATMALIALAEAWPHHGALVNGPWWLKAIQKTWDWIVAAVATGVTATFATEPFAIQHFNRIAIYGVVANLLAEPILGFVGLPALAIGSALAPLGLGDIPLKIGGVALELSLRIAETVAKWPLAVIAAPSAPSYVLAIAFVGLAFVSLWKGRLRWLGAPVAMAIILWPKPSPPDAWIDPEGASVVVKQGVSAVFLRPDAKVFSAQLWAHRRGLGVPSNLEDGLAANFNCDRFSCTPQPGATAPIRISAWFGKKLPKPEVWGRLCDSVDVVVIRAKIETYPQACRRSVVLSGNDFAVNGAVELTRSGSQILGLWTHDVRGDRPWTPAHISPFN